MAHNNIILKYDKQQNETCFRKLISPVSCIKTIKCLSLQN